MKKQKKEAPEILTPEQLQDKLDAMNDDWHDVYDRCRSARIAGDTARADDLFMIAVVMHGNARDFRREQEQLQLLRSIAQRAKVRRRKPVVPKTAPKSLA